MLTEVSPPKANTVTATPELAPARSVIWARLLAILLVDFAIEEMRAGKDRLTAILEAGHKRALPIVMTTVAMIAGMTPVAIGIGGDTSFRQPMAIAVIGGLITSTALTLVIVPAAFTLVDDIERWLAPKFGRVLTAQPPPSGTPPHPHPVK